MTLHVALTHRTAYRYDRPVRLGPQTVRLRPAPHARTPIISYALKIEPRNHFLNWQQDPQGNPLARIVFPDPVTHFEVTVDLVADMATINPFDFFLDADAETAPFTYDPVLDSELAAFRRADAPGPHLTAFLATLPTAPARTIDVLVDLNRRVREHVAYIVRLEPGVLTPEQTLQAAQGSCRDSAWLLVQTLRHRGFAARFVSGYLIQLKPDLPDPEAPGPAHDFTDLHAWAEVYLPGAGWIGLDATSGLLAGEGHIPLAASPEPASAAPISGLVDAAETTFDVHMQVVRLRETPRVTRPYDDPTWQAILAKGAEIDHDLARSDVRLTMGGEPTFVSRADPEAPEWTADALGPTKRLLSGRLARRLCALWSPGAALQYAAGKHYPGEQLPRWAIHLHWRRDGEPVWRNPALLASDEDANPALDESDSLAFALTLAERLHLDPARVLPAYEDIHHALWRENRLPANVTLEANHLRDPLARARLARTYAHGLNRPVGHVLPLRRDRDTGAPVWTTGRWLLRSDLLFLVPGDAAIGFRLPLESLPWADETTIEPQFDPDPFAPHPALTPHHQLALATPSSTPGPYAETHRPAAQDRPLVPGRGEPDLVRTALTVEVRDGRLHVFFPPLYDAEDWLDLAAAVEHAASHLRQRVILEGYLPPRDPRLLTFSVTPDPGVIEVNIHPAHTFPELVTRTEQLYAEARATGLAAEKFMLDGRHIGTGGGNHVVLGAADPADSPFLRRPDLLKSLLGFWHNHPSLSFLFSGLFIGPTSQHPRIDEARGDAVADLEIAFSQLAPAAARAPDHATDRAADRAPTPPPWLVDRLFRNILADMTGNTHRTEFCIDKLYAPESPSGRLGLVECRSFEMPPDPRMAAAQFLLVRAAVAAFWRHPYEHPLIRWGTRLHDDFMLPHFVQADFHDALADLATHGATLDPAWFAPHFAFRFPTIGETTLDGMTLELRHALEPWLALGEIPGIGGTVRFVDSSTERLQVRVSGFSPERYVLACQGRAVPLSPTGPAGDYVGGIRFKAWAPAMSLHPTIPAQTPLTVEIHDLWTGRSLGGITHHVAHPGGRAYETLPVNEGEAEARRRARFFPFGHTAGRQPPPRHVTAPETPRTLDLRRQ